jgi:hypothetical protein
VSYKIPVFLSYPKPFNGKQESFITDIKLYLEGRGFVGRTLGVTDYDMHEPLTAIRRLMLECNGIITIALKRTLIQKGITKPKSDIGETSFNLENKWMTSPYCQIEPAMAFQIGLPILIFREKDVVADGLLEKGVTGIYLPEIDLTDTLYKYLDSDECRQIIGKWEGFVRQVVENKGKPPKLF